MAVAGRLMKSAKVRKLVSSEVKDLRAFGLHTRVS
jgi:hypothetical protein